VKFQGCAPTPTDCNAFRRCDGALRHSNREIAHQAAQQNQQGWSQETQAQQRPPKAREMV
jgi:hypothetical protein